MKRNLGLNLLLAAVSLFNAFNAFAGPDKTIAPNAKPIQASKKTISMKPAAKSENPMKEKDLLKIDPYPDENKKAANQEDFIKLVRVPGAAQPLQASSEPAVPAPASAKTKEFKIRLSPARASKSASRIRSHSRQPASTSAR